MWKAAALTATRLEEIRRAFDLEYPDLFGRLTF
jgi:hypothetical protein